MLTTPDFTEITRTAELRTSTHGNRAKCLQRLIRLDLPVPLTAALGFDTVRAAAAGRMPDMGALLGVFGDGALVSVRSSSQMPDWGGPGTILNIGMNDAKCAELAEIHGTAAAEALYVGFIRAYAVDVLRLDADAFEGPLTPRLAKQQVEDEMEEPFPQSPAEQLAEVLRAMARAWNGTTARLLRQAQGAPADAGLGLVVQRMALGIGRGVSGSGVVQFVDADSGRARTAGRYLPQGQGRAALSEADAQFIASDPRGPALEDRAPDTVAALREAGALMRTRLREEMQIEFTLMDGRLSILDAVRAPRSGRAEVAVAVALAEDGVIARAEALTRVEPFTLNQVLHRQVRPEAPRDVLTRGIAAAPGAATGKIVFSAAAAQAAAAQGEACILVRRETSPEDIRGMHAAQAILTERGGMTSHAAVIARGLGLPCVSGATRLQLDLRKKTLTVAGRKVFHEGDAITVDGSTGDVLAGAAEMIEPALGGAFATLMDWADDARDIGIRANADTAEDAATAQRFGVDGIGLCRTEHMFFDPGRLTVMREMIFTENPADRAAALDRLLPMQRADFAGLFRLMRGQPVCIRLFDPPLHEFLPGGRDAVRALAEAGLAGQPGGGANREPGGIQPHVGDARRAPRRDRSRDLRHAGPRHIRGRDRSLETERAGHARDHDSPGVGPPRGRTGRGARRCRRRGRPVAHGQGFRLSPGRDGRNPARGAARRRDRRTCLVPVVRNQRPDADDLWAQPGRRRPLHVGLRAAGGLRRRPVHPPRHRRRGRTLAARRRSRAQGAGRCDPVAVRGTWRPARGDRILPESRLRLRLVLAVPGSRRQAGGGATVDPRRGATVGHRCAAARNRPIAPGGVAQDIAASGNRAARPCGRLEAPRIGARRVRRVRRGRVGTPAKEQA